MGSPRRCRPRVSGLPAGRSAASGSDLVLFTAFPPPSGGEVEVSYIPRMPQYRTIWISDVHLGTRGCKAEFLLDFLRHTESDNLYLVGDIVDGWRLRRSWYWAQSHNDVIQKVLRKARKGTKVIYIPGNHDEWLRDYTQIQ